MPYYSRIVHNSFHNQLFSKLFRHNRHIKAVGSGKAGKALALPDFPPSAHFYINACVPRRTDRCIKRHMRYYKDVAVFYTLIMKLQGGDVPHQPSNFCFLKRSFEKKSIVKRSFQPGWFIRGKCLLV